MMFCVGRISSPKNGKNRWDDVCDAYFLHICNFPSTVSRTDLYHRKFDGIATTTATTKIIHRNSNWEILNLVLELLIRQWLLIGIGVIKNIFHFSSSSFRRWLSAGWCREFWYSYGVARDLHSLRFTASYLLAWPKNCRGFEVVRISMPIQ